jgi:hypothetical protein
VEACSLGDDGDRGAKLLCQTLARAAFIGGQAPTVDTVHGGRASTGRGASVGHPIGASAVGWSEVARRCVGTEAG